MGKIVIMGASSGIGMQVAKRFISMGWKVGVAARNTAVLETLRDIAPEQVTLRSIDVTHDDVAELLKSLTDEMGDVDVFLNCSGVGWQNVGLDTDVELSIAAVNVDGFIRSVTYFFNYFSRQGHGRIAAISSIAGTKGLGVSPAYSATKSFESKYLQALAQLATIRRVNMGITDIRPGFVDTPLLNDSKKYPMLMKADKVADIIVRTILRGRSVKIIDWRYAALVFLWRLVPNCLWRRLRIKN